LSEAVSPVSLPLTLSSSEALTFCSSTSKGMSLVTSYLLKAQISFSFMGGNSTKATSGINGAGTNAQKELNIPDSAKIFFQDTKKSVRSARLD
jgi:hypothetical protein